MAVRTIIFRSALRAPHPLLPLLPPIRAFTSSSNPLQPGVAATIDLMFDKLRDAASSSHSEQHEGVPEAGLRMLVFGKPGSGKVGMAPSLVTLADEVGAGDVEC